MSSEAHAATVQAPDPGPSAPIGPGTIVHLIERATANPTVVDKIERLVERSSRGAY